MSHQPFRILALDGGPTTPTYMRYLQTIEEACPGFLAQVDLIAGTSSGSMSTLYLASRPQLDLAAVKDAVAFADETFYTLSPGILGQLRLLASLPMDSQKLETHLGRYLGTETTLGDLHRKVAVVSYRLRSPHGPKVFHNLGENSDREERAVDVALRSGAAPIALPIRNGYVDGAIIANNPSMCAVATALASGEVRDLKDVVVFSLGGDDRHLTTAKDNTKLAMTQSALWGWVPWLIKWKNPLLLAKLMLNGSGKGVAYLCQQLLGDRHLRLAFIPEGASVKDFTRIFLNRSEKVVARARRTATRFAAEADSTHWTPNLNQTLDWIQRCWMPE